MKTEWKQVKFGEVVKLNNERVADPEAEGVERYVGIEHIEPEDLRIRSWGLVAEGTTFTNQFRPGQVLFVKRRAYQRKVAVADFAGVCSGDIYVLEPKDPQVLLPELLPFICQTDGFFNHAVGTSAGSLSPRTNWTQLANYEFALPPLEEQRRITRLLKSIEALGDAFVSAQTHLNICRKSYLENIFSREYAQTISLEKIAEIVSGGTPSRRRKDYWDGNIAWLSPKDMKQPMLEDTTEHISSVAVQDGAKLAPSNTIFIVVRGMILAHTFPVCRSKIEMAFNQDVRAIVPGDTILPEFLHAWFDWAAPRYLQLVSESSHGTKRLETSQLLRKKVPIYTKAQQQEILVPIQKIDSELESLSLRQKQVSGFKSKILADISGG